MQSQSCHYAEINGKRMTLPFVHPCTIVLAGSSNSGKTFLTKQILDNRHLMFDPPPQKVIWCYSEYQPLYTEINNTEFHEGMYDIDTLDTSKPTLIVYDDLSQNEQVDKEMVRIFTKLSHHRNLSCIYITQNLFAKNKYATTISRNSSYLIVMSSPRDRAQISYLARQIYPSQSKFLIEAYRSATEQPHGYLLMDFRQSTPEKFRVRTKILPNENTEVYVSKSQL